MKKSNLLKKLYCLSFTSFIIASSLIATSCINNVDRQNNKSLTLSDSPGATNLELRDEIICIVKKIQVGLKVDDFLVSAVTAKSWEGQTIDNSWIEQIVGELVDNENFNILKRYSGSKKLEDIELRKLIDKFKNFYYNRKSFRSHYKEYKLIETALVTFLSGKKQKVLQSLDSKYRFFNGVRNYYIVLFKKYHNKSIFYNNGHLHSSCSGFHVLRNFFGDFYTSLIGSFINADWDFSCKCPYYKKYKLLCFLKENLAEFIAVNSTSDLVYIKGTMDLELNTADIDPGLYYSDSEENEYVKYERVYSRAKRELFLAVKETIEYLSDNRTMPTHCDCCKKIYKGSYIDSLYDFKCGYKLCIECIQQPWNLLNANNYNHIEKLKFGECKVCGSHDIEKESLDPLVPSLTKKFKQWEEKTISKYKDLDEELNKNKYIFGMEKEPHLFSDLNLSLSRVKIRDRRKTILSLFLEKASKRILEENKHKLSLEEYLVLMVADWNIDEISKCYQHPYSEDKNRLISFLHIKRTLESAIKKISLNSDYEQDPIPEEFFVLVNLDEYGRMISSSELLINKIKQSMYFYGFYRFFSIEDLRYYKSISRNSLGRISDISLPVIERENFQGIMFKPIGLRSETHYYYCKNKEEKELLIDGLFRENLSNKELYMDLSILIGDFVGNTIRRKLIVDLNPYCYLRSSIEGNGFIGLNLFGSLELDCDMDI